LPLELNFAQDIKDILNRSLERGGEMRYFVIKKGIQRLADNDILSCLQQTDVVQLQFNVDGLPLFKSSNMQLWPIIIIYFHGFFRNSDK